MYMFSDGMNDLAYFIIPDPNGEQIRHQYGCVACRHFDIVGRVEKVPHDLAVKLVDLLDCFPSEPAVIKLETGLDVAEVLGESLARLSDGRYVVTDNCD